MCERDKSLKDMEDGVTYGVVERSFGCHGTGKKMVSKGVERSVTAAMTRLIVEFFGENRKA